ncbi:MAG: acyl-CoA dehydrogenase family protein, partial [Candidatus Alcyoniella australis]|nr:acyl-CoA dehydrogenase family protein [Candidatus Alcyoniella australis]
MDLEHYELLRDDLYEEEHKIYRQAFRRFCEIEIVPFQEQWDEDGCVPRELWTKAGDNGFLCPQVDEKYGGLGADFRYAVINIEELSRIGHTGFFITLHNDVVVPYIEAFGSEEQKHKWLPRCISGEAITAVDMTEPGTGSDLAAIRTTAIRDGDEWVINGQKTFISSGLLCDLAIVAAKTDPKADPHSGISLFLVEADRSGFVKGKKLRKIGMHSQDTAEHFFEDCRIPLDNILGDENA